MLKTNFPPEPIREGYANGSHFLELSDGTIETFENIFARNLRKTELRNMVNAELERLTGQLEYRLS